MKERQDIKRLAEDVSKAADFMIENGLTLDRDVPIDKQLLDPKGRRLEYYRNVLLSYPRTIRSNLSRLKDVGPLLEMANKMEMFIALSRFKEVSDLAKRLAGDISVADERSRSSLMIHPPKLPSAIQGEIHADLREMQRCFDSQCFRSSVILCGRVLETCLHRKYYEMTGKDILETNPGIGLGKLIAKLKELDVKFDPGITEQIHLINQVRIYSVHKSQEVFIPSKNQALAMILYTMDILKKLF